ncbi:MAG: hypothetical protein SXA11_14180 [Cyanobacteriota bacterium]|nr:hypothetical protein [Cyanobacteriota bacterium]
MKNEPENHKILAAFKERDKITQALTKAVNNAVLQHKQNRNPIATWREGKVVWIPPEEIAIE